jgi:hypothetical protein
MTQESYRHPITPPPELLKHWEDQHFDEGENYDVMLTQAYQAGADQELEACCEWLEDTDCDDPQDVANHLRAARRPSLNPPSLKHQALKVLRNALRPGEMVVLDANEYALLCSALEQLSDHK